MKSELSKAKPQTKHFSWTLDESKYLNLDKVKKLRTACERAKNRAIQESKPVGIGDIL